MKILVVGDVHGRFSRLNEVINKQRPELILCCGDFGYWPKIPGEQLTNIKPQGSKILWCEGNHEDHWSLRDRQTDELVQNVIYMPRGSTYDLPDGRTIMFFGGADSIDKNVRTLGIDWFPEEVITQKDFENLPYKKIDIFITHTCPGELVDMLRIFYPEKPFEPSNQALSELWKIYKPSLWIFGHWHQFVEGRLEETKWYCLSHSTSTRRWWMWLPEKEEI